MSLTPLDLQIAVNQINNASQNYLKRYSAARKNQLNQEKEIQNKSKLIKSKVQNVSKDINYLPHTKLDSYNKNKNKKNIFNTNKKKIKTIKIKEKKNLNIISNNICYKEPNKGIYIDIKQ